MEKSKQKAIFEKYVPFLLNCLIFVFSITGFFLSCYFARRDGYSHWLRRLLYFTQQSNLWIGITSLAFAIMLAKGEIPEKRLKIISVFKYIFTVSITVTGIIFCALLAPFADYDVWYFASVLTHVVVPILSILDFFTNKNIVKIDKKYVWFSLIPPAAYFIFASILGILGVDFGRGVAYPYFFMDYYSELGLFGFLAGRPPQFGSFYWLVFFLIFIYFLGFAYYKIHAYLSKKRALKSKK